MMVAKVGMATHVSQYCGADLGMAWQGKRLNDGGKGGRGNSRVPVLWGADLLARWGHVPITVN